MLDFYVTKADGQKEVFYYRKLENSLRKAGANEDTIKYVIDEISNIGKDGITTQEIYRRAFSILRKKQRPTALRYSLKKAVAMLGPTGFPFEKLVSEIFEAEGYKTIIDQIVNGKCVDHEIDVVAWKDHELIMSEAKFHTDYNLKSDLKVVLYVKARYDDIFGKEYNFGGEKRKLTEGWIITNTKFSSTAIQYGQCQPSIKFVGWNYPYNYNLHQMIEKHELIPVTALTTITTAEKKLFIDKKIVVAKKLIDTNLLKSFGFDDRKIKSIQKEVLELCEHCKRSFANGRKNV